MSEIILPGSNLKGTEEYTKTDFNKEIMAENIKSTFLNTGDNVEFPLVCIDLSKTNDTMMIALDSLKKFILTEEYILERKEQGEDLKLVHLYLVGSNKKLVKIGVITDRVAYQVLSDFVRDVFPDSASLFLSEDGVEFKNMKESKLAKLKFKFEGLSQCLKTFLEEI